MEQQVDFGRLQLVRYHKLMHSVLGISAAFFNNDFTEEGISLFPSVSPDIIKSCRLQRLHARGSAVS